ncbi:FMN-dependent NADH-azoreductase [Cognaticolwellia beringensis]|uniref:FMN dependent NADH:quinone oxidoreductase n=1 Tax=Cognaticolwellia beringensis TaxID=1967665 RepID=A0A222G9S0_9GAMM|nr:NAD(P)H-dependent oxidoreductase [Cognaticolwellia beringensis]ASP48629.1 FMN-dependent NADH-azoreductase [Cognaticolwellia beringensis]
MNNILFIKSSLNGEQGNSTKLAQELVTNLSATSEVKVVDRDLAKQALAHLTQEEMAAWMAQESERTEQQALLASVSDSLITELTKADTLVVAMPMYNFGVPSTFKAWVDRVARAGVTFRYTENGPVGLLKNKRVIVVAARGGMHAGTTSDSQTQYLTSFFNFIGIDNIDFIYAEGLNMPGGDERFAAAQSVIKSVSL